MSPHSEDASLAAAQVQWRQLLHRQVPVLTTMREHSPELFLRPENLRNNRHFGHQLQAKLSQHTRIYCQNVNGLKLDQEGGDFTELCFLIKEVQADITGITEHNVDATKHYVNHLLFDNLRRKLKVRSKMTVGTTPITSANVYKPGGTLTISSGNITSRHVESGSDALGRWTYQTFSCGHQGSFTVVTAYQVCDKSETQKGRSTAAAQQESLLRQRGEADPKPRKHFRKDLLSFLKQLKAEKHEILLTGDFNEVLGDDENGMCKICSEIGLTDLMAQVHDSTDVATYSRGTKRIDYALGSERVALAICFCGYEPFQHRLFSDHRAFFLDVDTEMLFGNETQKLPPMAFRDIQSKCPKQVTTYLETLHSQLESRNWFNRMDALESKTIKDHDLAERLDEDFRQFCISSGGKCIRFREPQWSRALDKARAKVTVLKIALSVARVGIDVGDQLRCIQIEHEVDFLIPDTVKECNKELKIAQVAVKKIARDSFNTRIQEMEERMTDLYLSSDTSDADKLKILKHIKKAEELRRMFRKLGYLRREKGETAVNRLEIPVDPDANPKEVDKDDPTKWRTIKVPSEIEKLIATRNRAHFGQAEGPWLEPPLSQSVDFTASTITSELILQGEYDASDLDDITQLMINHLKVCDQEEEPLPMLITDDELVGKLRKWKETTTTSPSKLHLGHWKALIARHSHSHAPRSDRCLEMDSMQQQIRRGRLQLINYAIKWGYSFDRWKEIVNVMILKDPGVFRIHRLRVIHIYEADYNLILGIKWRQLMHHAIDHNLLNKSQYGRPGGNPTAPVFVEELENEISRVSRKSMVKFDNDATSCYDRILAAIASITSRKYGLHRNVALLNARTLQEARYKLKTALGVTEEFYQHCEIFPIYGTGQGSQNSPAIWCVISSVLFDCFETRATGACFESPDRSQSITIYMVGFVDDSTGGVNAFAENKQPSPHILLERMRLDAQLWNDLLWTSAGALELIKCSYHVIHYQFTSDGAPILQAGQVGPDLILDSGDRSTSQKIPSLTAHTAHKTLGHYKDPAGNQSKQYDKLKEKSDKAGLFVQCSPLDHKEAWTYYFSIYLLSVGYPLPNCFFSFKRLDAIQRKAIRAIIAKCGFNRNTHRSIIYGPACLGGSTFCHLYTIQSCGQILQFLRTWRTPSQASRLLKIAVAWTQYAVGTGVSFLTDVTTELPHMEAKWLGALRVYLKKIGATIEVDETGVVPLQRVNDAYIMTLIIESGRFTPSQVIFLNYCREFLQVTTIAELTTADGETLDRAMLLGTPDINSNTTRYHHFNQASPSKKVWNLWFKANMIWSNGITLRQSLGPWLIPQSQQRQQARAYFDHKNRVLYMHEDGELYCKHAVGDTVIFEPETELVSLPSHVLPTRTYSDNGREWDHPENVATLYREPKGPAPGTFIEFLAALPFWEASLFHSLQLEKDPFSMIEDLVKFPFACTSDGSVRFKAEGSFGWALSLANNTNLAHCSGPVFGSKPTSYRAEGYGLLSMIRFIIRLSEYCSNLKPLNKSRMASDNSSLVDTVTSRQLPSALVDSLDPDSADRSLHYMAQAQTSLVSDWDILNEIRVSLPELPMTPKILWVKGHQDDNRDYEDLPLLARLNVDADRFAGEFQDQFGASRPTVPRLEHNGAQLQIDGETITYKEKAAIRYAETAKPLREHIKARNGWEDKDMQTIDWDAHGSAIRRGNTNRVHLVKLVHDLLPTNSNVYRFVDDRTNNCPTCQHDNEDRDHLIRCSHPARARWRKSCLIAVRKATDKDTLPYLQNILLDGLTAFFADEAYLSPAVYPSKYGKLIRHQNRLGWRQLFNGRMSTEWARLQDDYLYNQKRLSKTSSGVLWTTRVITVIWAQFAIVWESRNSVVHGHDASSRSKIRRDMAQNQVKRIYRQRQNLLPRDRDFLFDDIADHLKNTTTSLLNWVATYKPLFKDSIKRAKKNSTKGVKAISTYFGSLGTRKKKKKKKTNEATATDILANADS